MSFFGISFGQSADIDIILDNQDDRKMAEIRDENGRKERHYLFFDGESVTGKVNVTLHRKTNRLEHQGIKIEFIGQIELYYDRGNHHEFLSLVKELARPGDITQNTSFDFEFNQVEKPYECYTGANVRLRYFLRVTIVRRITDMTKEMDLLVHTLSTYPEMNNPIKMEVGIEECLHIEFEYNKSKYHLKDVIVGKIYFLLVRIKIKHMEVAIIKRETTGSGPNISVDSETIAKYEIMDGAPVKGESIPIRVFLAGYDLTPTMRDINKKFSVKYYLNLVLVDEEERRYFKQQEITLWRKSERPRKMMMYHQGQMVPGYPAGMHPGYMPGSMVPHALARHNPGDYPSQNVRTAPTPSGDEPVTPSVDYPTQQQVPIPGPSANNASPQEEPAHRQPEEDSSKDQSIEDETVPSPTPVPEPVAKPQTPEQKVVDGAENATASLLVAEPVAAKAVPVAAKAVSEPEVEKEEAAIRHVVNSVTDLNVNDADDDDDKPQPPEDDTVPDMDDSLEGNPALDEDLSNNDADDLFSSTAPAIGVKDSATSELGNDDL